MLGGGRIMFYCCWPLGAFGGWVGGGGWVPGPGARRTGGGIMPTPRLGPLRPEGAYARPGCIIGGAGI